MIIIKFLIKKDKYLDNVIRSFIIDRFFDHNITIFYIKLFYKLVF